jgi:hypothetical protein
VPEIRELDLNPVIALAPGQGCRVVDARIRVAPPRETLPGSGRREPDRRTRDSMLEL